MAVIRTLAVGFGLWMAIGATAPARGDGIASDLRNLWQYWSSREGEVKVITEPFLTRELTFPATSVTPAPALAQQVVYPAPTRPSLPARYSAYLNFDGQRLPDAAGLVDVNAVRPWYTSPTVTRFFGGQAPDSGQQAAFTTNVLDRVSRTFQNSGLGEVKLTNDPAANAKHTLSVISGTTYQGSDDILGMTYTGGSGFSFLDNFGHPAVDSLDKLETALAKNIAHELMHAFGGDHHGSESRYIDAATTTWDKLTNDATVFSPGAADDIRSLLDGSKTALFDGIPSGERVLLFHRIGCSCDGCCGSASALQVRPIPEPSTLAIGGLGALAMAFARRRGRRPA